MRAPRMLIAVCLAAALMACGGGGGGTAPAPTYTVSGTISGLLPGNSVVLVDSGTNPTSYSLNGNQSYTGPIVTGTAYAITVKTQPPGQTCVVANDSGIVASGNVTNVTVTCTGNPYSVTATVSGLAGGQSLVLKLNGGGDIPVTADGSYTFGTTVPSGSSYAVTLSPPPAGQPCAIAHGSGKIAQANIGNVQVTCGATQFNLGVSLTGLPFGASITLSNGAEVLTFTTNSTANFATPLAYNSSYTVSITASPANQFCAVSGGSGSGTITGTVTVAVDCPHFAYVSTNLDSSVSIYAINNATGVLTEQSSISPVVNAAANPYGIAISPDLVHVYVPATGGTGILGYSSSPASGALTAINNGTAFTTDNRPWCIAFNPLGTFAFASNYASNTVSVFGADPATGLLTPVSGGPYGTGNHPFGVVVAPNANFVYVSNSDGQSISVFSFDMNGALAEITGSPFAIGDITPVMAIDPSGSFAYVLGNHTGTVIAYTIDATGALTAVPGGPVATATNNPSGIAIHPNGKFVYVVNYASPLGSVSVYAITPVTGALTLGGIPVPTADGAEWITIDPTGQFAYVTNQISYAISAYSIDAATGALTPLPTSSSVPTGHKPEVIVFR